MSASAYPSKTFFVSMLTRDIELKDAILDLLDNCVDGILRHQQVHPPKNKQKPYEGFWAKITITDKTFSIEDNCGGIPKKIAEESAFRLGRVDLKQDKDLPTVGMYGIGMKRAIFKMGTKARVTSKHKPYSYYVDILPSWLSKDEDWELPLTDTQNGLDNEGTRIVVNELHENISRQFVGKNFEKELREDIGRFFAIILMKGFTVFLNNTEVPLSDFRLLFYKDFDLPNQIQPYVYKAKIKDVSIEMVVGFYRELASTNEIEKEEEEEKDKPTRKSENAGWTVICNDRVVLYRDKSRLTGWGIRDVPRYHTQFIAISGVVKFTSTNSLSLPLGTTKRNIDTSSDVYEKALDRMMDGLKQFTNFTNKWKGNEEGTSDNFKKMELAEPSEIVKSVKKWSKVRGSQEDEQKFVPDLPEPPRTTTKKRIAFYKPSSEIETLAEYFFGDPEVAPSEVGERSFDEALSRARKSK